MAHHHAKVGSAQGGAKGLAGAERHAGADALQQQRVCASVMTEVIDGKLIDAGKPPAARAQPRAKIELLSAVQVAVGEEADRFDCGAPIDAAAVQSRDVPWAA